MKDAAALPFLEYFARRFGFEIRHCRLTHGHAFRVGHRIYLDRRLSASEVEAALLHELGHALLNHETPANGRAAAMQELRAEALADALRHAIRKAKSRGLDLPSTLQALPFLLSEVLEPNTAHIDSSNLEKSGDVATKRAKHLRRDAAKNSSVPPRSAPAQN